MKNDPLENLTSRLVWHEVLASVMRRYCGKILPDELVVPAPTVATGQTLVVCVQQDGLHIKLVSNSQAQQLLRLAEAQVSGSVN